jgi:hypothetical protein
MGLQTSKYLKYIDYDPKTMKYGKIKLYTNYEIARGVIFRKFLHDENMEFIDFIEKYPMDKKHYRYKFGKNHSGSYNQNIISDMLDYVCESNDQYFKEDALLWFINEDPEYCQYETECKRIGRAIYYLIFNDLYEITKEDIKYIEQKIWFQKIYECVTGNKVVPIYVYNLYFFVLNIISIKNKKNKSKIVV